MSGLVVTMYSSPGEARGVCPQSARTDISAQEGMEASRLLAGEATAQVARTGCVGLRLGCPYFKKCLSVCLMLCASVLTTDFDLST